MEIIDLSNKIERVSQLYAKKFGIKRQKSWFVLKLQEEMGELIQSYLMMTGQARKKDKLAQELRQDFEHEVVDVLSHTLLLARHFKIDLKKVMDEKWLKWNK